MRSCRTSPSSRSNRSNMANPPPKKCPRCSNTLAVAALNPQHLWCSICAVEFDLRAQELPENIKAAEEQAEAQIQAPAAVVTVRDAASAGAAAPGLALPQVPVPQVPVLPAAQRGRRGLQARGGQRELARHKVLHACGGGKEQRGRRGVRAGFMLPTGSRFARAFGSEAICAPPALRRGPRV